MRNLKENFKPFCYHSLVTRGYPHELQFLRERKCSPFVCAPLSIAFERFSLINFPLLTTSCQSFILEKHFFKFWITCWFAYYTKPYSGIPHFTIPELLHLRLSKNRKGLVSKSESWITGRKYQPKWLCCMKVLNTFSP